MDHPRSPIRTLIVDDEPLGRERIRMLLQDNPEVLLVGECKDGHEAVEAIKAQQPDLVFLDVQMPGMNGFEVCHRLKSDPSTKAIRVIGMTGDFSADNKARIMATGAETCLLKPFDRATLLAVIGLDADISGSLRT